MKSKRLFIIVFCCVALLLQPARGAEFIALDPANTTKTAEIVLYHDAVSSTGINWNGLNKLPAHSRNTNLSVLFAVQYLREAVQRMTGRRLAVTSRADTSRGIVLMLLKDAPATIKNDDAVQAALRNTGEDMYNANEAFFVRSEANRTLLVANTPDGLCHAVAELLESVGYEVLGMGPNWIHVPDYKDKPLVFDIEHAGRPGLYNRKIWVTSAQERGNGTLLKVFDAADEPVGESYRRWQIGTRTAGRSIPQVGGHSMQAYHSKVAQKLKATQTTDGFLVPQTITGLDAKRPAASPQNTGTLWINSDAEGTPPAGKAFISDGDKWVVQNPREYRANLDLSVPLVRATVLEDLKARAQATFEANPDDTFVFGADPEDGGGYANFSKWLKKPNWYPEYLKEEGIVFGQPYKLHGVKGLDQPRELWDPQAPTDTVFGFANWLGREYDKWIDSLPVAERVTSTGQDKKKLLTIGLLSYNYYDVPPNFNIDSRIRVKISSFPKHRGLGKWKNFVSGNDMAQAFQVLLPRQPSDVGWYFSNAQFSDHSLSSIGKNSDLPEVIQKRVAQAYRAGFRGIGAEMDFNFGRLGLAHYLYAKMLWDPHLSATQLTAIRDRWLQRAYGNGWQEMRQYYKFMAPQNFAINAPNNWAKAIRFIEAADRKIDQQNEPDAQRRLDDLKQYWYFFYLLDSKQTKPPSPAFQEFVWKGQMSYMTPMYMVVKRFFNVKKVDDAIPADLRNGPAHYTHEETQAWWPGILAHWKVTTVSEFKDATLANGIKGNIVDLNDLVPVAAFQAHKANTPFSYNGYQNDNMTLMSTTTKPGEEIGFKLFWPWTPGNRSYEQREIFYGISHWNPQSKEWDEVVDQTMTSIQSHPVPGPKDRTYQMVEARHAAALPGTYRITLGIGGFMSQLTSLDYDLVSGRYSGTATGFTYAGNLTGHTQSAAWFYIPKGTKSLDLEVWDANGKKQITFYTPAPAGGLKKGRVVNVGQRGTHTVALQTGEDGTLAAITGGGFYFPYFYSVPQLWAKSPSALLVPRAIAKADGLTIAQ